MQVFSVLCQRVARYLQQPVTGAYVDRQIVQFINETYREIWDMDMWPQTVTAPTVVTLAAGSNEFVLPKSTQSILRAYQSDATGETSDRNEIRILGMVEFADAQVQPFGGNFLWQIAPFGSSGTLAQPEQAEQLNVYSTSAQDLLTSSIAVYLKGEDSTGEVIGESVLLNDQIPVLTVLSYAVLYNVSKTKNTDGTVLVKDNANTVTLATIGKTEPSPLYTRYRTNVAPTSDTPFTIVGKRRFVPMIDNADTAFCDMDLALVSGAVARAWAEAREMELAAQWNSKFQNDLGELKRRELNADGSIEMMVPSLRA